MIIWNIRDSVKLFNNSWVNGTLAAILQGKYDWIYILRKIAENGSSENLE